jgi:hypothetical protein
MTASMCSRRASRSSARIGNFHGSRRYTRARLAALLHQLATRYDRSLPTGFLRWNSLAHDALKTLQVH